jgi:uncharacterized protein (TIGR03066 family)
MVKCLRLALAVVFVFGAVAVAQEKKADLDQKKLVGNWVAVKGSETVPPGATFTFTKDNKLKITVVDPKGMTQTLEGTYKIEGAAMKVTLKLGDKEHTETIKVPELTDTKLVTVDEKNKKDIFEKKK